MKGFNFGTTAGDTAGLAPDRRNALLLPLGRILSGLGSGVFSFGMGLYVLDLTGSAAIFSLIFSLSILPGVLVNLFVSVLVDRWNKKRVMALADIGSGAIVLLFMFMFATNGRSVVLFVVYSILLSILGSLFNLAINAAIPDFIDKDNVAGMNSIIQGISAVVSIVGPIIGAILYKTLGLGPLFLINAIALILAGSSELFLVNLKGGTSTGIGNAGGKTRGRYIEDLGFTFRYLGKVRILAFFFLLAAIINFLYNPLMLVVLPYINYNEIKVSGLQLSVIQASGAFGIIVAATVLAVKKFLHKILLRKFFVLFMAQAVLIMLWAFPQLPFFAGKDKWAIVILFSLLLVLYGAMNTAQNIPMITYFQLRIPVELRARIIGVFSTALFLTTPVGMWLYGLLLEKIQWFTITMASGAVMLAIGFIAGRNKHYRQFLSERDIDDKEESMTA